MTNPGPIHGFENLGDASVRYSSDSAFWPPLIQATPHRSKRRCRRAEYTIAPNQGCYTFQAPRWPLVTLRNTYGNGDSSGPLRPCGFSMNGSGGTVNRALSLDFDNRNRGPESRKINPSSHFDESIDRYLRPIERSWPTA